jgi:hypothetical protein
MTIANNERLSMPDRRCIQLLGVIVLLNILHFVNHILREGFHWPIDEEQSVGFLIVATVIISVP